MLIFPILIAAAAAEDAPIVVKAFPWAPFISPMGEPFRAPCDRRGSDRTLVRPGRPEPGRVLTADEMQADADRFFVRLDSNHDGQIIPDEIKAYEYEIAPEVQVNSNWKRPRGEAAPEPEARTRPSFR